MPQVQPAPQLVQGLPDFTALVSKVGPAVVNIDATTKAKPARVGAYPDEDQIPEIFRRFFGPGGMPFPMPQDPRERGPGVVRNAVCLSPQGREVPVGIDPRSGSEQIDREPDVPLPLVLLHEGLGSVAIEKGIFDSDIDAACATTPTCDQDCFALWVKVKVLHRLLTSRIGHG